MLKNANSLWWRLNSNKLLTLTDKSLKEPEVGEARLRPVPNRVVFVPHDTVPYRT